MTRRPLVLASISAAVLVIVAASDWPWGVLHEFWGENGMVTNIVASLVFILIGATILDQWQARRNAVQLRAVTLAAYHAVARIPLTRRRIMWVLVNGGEFRWDDDFTFTVQQQSRRRQVFARCGLPDVTVFDVRGGVEPVPDLDERLGVLAQDLHRGRKETEAESVAHIVCLALGLDSSRYSDAYVLSWAKGDLDLIKEAMETVTRVAKSILSDLTPVDAAVEISEEITEEEAAA